jgi:CBS domain containing-hemolysin-like protein
VEGVSGRVTGIIGLIVVVALIAANGLFVAAEFSLVSVRRSAVDADARAGSRRATLVRKELADISFALSSAQFGITVTSLLVGYIAEQAIGDTVFRPLLRAIGVPEEAALGVAVTGAFLLSTVVQMVFGELFPQRLAVARPMGVAKGVTPFTRAFGIAFSPVIRVFHRAAETITERVFRVEVRDELEGGHSLDEFARIVAASSKAGSLTDWQSDLLRRAVALGDVRVREAMVARPDVVWVDRDGSVADLLRIANSTGHSRFPVRGRGEDDVVGSVHVKNVLAVAEEHYATTPIAAIVDPIAAVPESRPVRRLLADLRREQRTFALVVDEYGGTAGIVTIEDVVEQLVGDILDEFDPDDHDVHRVGARHHLVRGSLRLRDVEHVVGRTLPAGDYDTLAGFVLSRLGHLPEVGETVRHDDVEITVTRVDGRRIQQLALRVVDGETAQPERS